MTAQTPTVGQAVVDLDGAAIGEVDQIYREAESETLRTEPVAGESRFGIGFLQVGARVEGLGQILYIPFSEITDLDEVVHINVHKDAVKNREWDLRPPVLDEPQWQSH
jgi:hypothetical protein